MSKLFFNIQSKGDRESRPVVPGWPWVYVFLKRERAMFVDESASTNV